MIHERFDIERWKAEFPLPRLRAESRAYLQKCVKGSTGQRWVKESRMSESDYIEAHVDWYILARGPWPDCPENITGPITIAVAEQLRAENLKEGRGIARLPTDLFIFSRGEPERRDITKIGGLPYWPAGRDWPRAPSGAPLTFIAQFNFADSRDIAGDLPGDVLVMFGDQNYYWSDDPAFSGIHFAWLPLGQTDLIHPTAIPATAWRIMPCFGQIYRTYDHPLHDSDPAGDDDWDDEVAEIEEEQWYRVLNGVKIGGIPRWSDFDPREYMPGRFLCALSEVRPNRRYPYPYINVREPLGHPPGPEDDVLEWDDCDLANFFIADDGMHWRIEK